MQVLSHTLRFDEEKFKYAIYRLRTDGGKEVYQAVAFKELRYIPQEMREDPDLLGKMHLAVRGMYEAGIKAIYAACGIYKPERLGLVQFYGARGIGSTEDEAAQEALSSLAAIEGLLSNYPQSRLEIPENEKVLWLFNALESMCKIGVLLGHPDPRKSERGLGRDGKVGEADEELASQQNEILFRALAALGKNFVFLVVAQDRSRQKLTQQLIEVARVASNYASRVNGSVGVNFTIAIPLSAVLGTGSAATGGRSDGRNYASTVSEAETWGKAHTDSRATTESESISRGVAHTVGGFSSTSTTKSWGTTDTHGTAHTEGGAHTDSHSWGIAHTEGSSWSTSTTSTTSTTQATGLTHATGTADTHSSAHTQSRSASTGVNFSHSHSTSVAETSSSAISVGQSVGESHTQSKQLEAGISGGLTVGASGGIGIINAKADATIGSHISEGIGWADTSSRSTSSAVEFGSAHTSGVANTVSFGTSQATSVGIASSTGTAHTESESVATSTSTATTIATSTTSSHGGFSSTTRSETWGTADTKSWADTTSSARSTSVSNAVTATTGSSWATTTSEVRTKGIAHTIGSADTSSYARSTGRGETEGVSSSVSKGGGWGTAAMLGAGIVPAVGISRSWQTVDDSAARAAELIRLVESLLNQAAAEGGFVAIPYLLVDDEDAQKVAHAAAIQAFHGLNVPTPVQVLWTDDAHLREHVRSFTLCTIQDKDPFGVGLWTRYTTLLTADMLAAYMAPSLFEEGTAVTVQERIPPVGFYPELKGEVVIGHQISPETGRLTNIPLRLSKSDYFHAFFFADTGFGKTVAAMRMVYEAVKNWGMATIVFDFGTGWRALFNAPHLRGKVDIRQLSPGGVRPLRWNPLQIGRNIAPELQWRAFCDIFGAVAKLGVRRQIGELRDALRRVYLRAGVLVDDPEVRQDPLWGVVRPGEEEIAGAPAGTLLSELADEARQRLAVERSKAVGLEDLYREIEEKLSLTPARDTMLRGVLEGILYRLHPLVLGAASKQYAKGDAEDIAAMTEKFPVVILEGGAFLDEFSKAFLLAWAAWQIYTDAVVRRIREKQVKEIQMVFEEANKIFGGVGDGDEDEGGVYTAEQLERMWLDSRKYGVWLIGVAQKPSKLPGGVFSSAANIFIGQLKDPRDRDLVVAALGRSEKGFVDEPWRRFIARLPIGRFVARLAYSKEISRQEPIYFQPLKLEAEEPTDEEIAQALSRIEI